MNPHETFMRRCIALAEKGALRTAPNPMVGSVILHDGKIIGSGFHRAFGEAHAEVNAVAAVRDRSLLKNSTLYVNLEPCAHSGKTPPCADMIVACDIPRVVIGQEDPNPLTAGKGIDKLRKAGIDVTVGVLESDCRHLNRRFNTYHSLKRPYILLKWAQTADGFMDIERSAGDTGIHWISHPAVKKKVHKRRAAEGAILIGAATAANDNPSLTVRSYAGRNPHRVVISQRGLVPANAALFNDGNVTEVISRRGGPESPLLSADGTLIWTTASEGADLALTAVESLYKRGILSVMVEGGRHTLQRFIDADLWDEAMVITAPGTAGSGLRAPALNAAAAFTERYATDTVSTYFKQ